MHKRVLLAEKSDTMRAIAESVLRQNGFEVLSMISGEQALEVLKLTRPDLILVGSDLRGKGQQPLYEEIQQIPNGKSVPLLLFCDPDEAGLPFPEELLIPRPFDPNDFINRVNTFTGQSDNNHQAKADSVNPFSDAKLEDDFLDSALGLDNINVTESEVMDKTQSIILNKNKMKNPEKMIGFDHYENNTETHSNSQKIESLIIQDDKAEIDQSKKKKEAPQQLSASGKIEILNDQFGLIEPTADEKDENLVHDYDWFLNEIKKDGESPPSKTIPSEQKNNQSSPISITDNASVVDPVTPPPQSSESNSKISSEQGVDKFINEFKQEVEKFASLESENINIEVDKQSQQQNNEEKINWEDSLEQVTPENLALFKKQFVMELAERIAIKIANKIDSEKLLNLLKNELLNQIKKNQKSSN